MTDPRNQRRQSAERYHAATRALDEYIEQREAEQAAGVPVVTGDERDVEYEMLTEAYWQARREETGQHRERADSAAAEDGRRVQRIAFEAEVVASSLRWAIARPMKVSRDVGTPADAEEVGEAIKGQERSTAQRGRTPESRPFSPL